MVLGGSAKPNKEKGEMEYVVNNAGIAGIMTAVSFLITFRIYVGFTCVIWAVFTIEHPQGPQYVRRSR